MRATRIIPGTVVFGTVIAALLGFHFWTTHAANRTWTGGAFPNNLWSNSSNWSTNVAPVAGDTLTFGGSISPISQNNFPNFTTFSSLTISGGHFVQGASIALNTGISASNGHIQLASIKLNNGQIFFAPIGGVSADISSAIDTNGQFLSLRGPGNLVLTGGISGSGNLLKLDSGTVHLSGANSYTGGTSVSGGTLVVLGSHPAGQMEIIGGGTLGGTGTVGSISVIVDAGLAGGKVSPGNVNQSGVLNVNGNVIFSANGNTGLDIGMNGAAVGSGYDQLNVTGLVNLGGASLNPSLSFTPPPGATFIIINNDGNDPVTGTFLNHQEGSSFIVNNTTFFITYRGGNGNDVVLHVGETKTWDGGGANNLWTTGANWSGNTAPQVGDDLVFPSGATRLISNNDFPANTTFKSITISGIGYTLNGNALNLTSTFTSPTLGSFNTVNLAIGGTCSLTSGANLILTGNNTYTGPTTINRGLLTINGNQPASSVTLNGGALDGLGTVGSITASAGSAVRPGLFFPSSAGTLNAGGNVSFSAASTFSAFLTFDSNGSAQTSKLNVTGEVLINSSANWPITISGAGTLPSGVDLVMINNDGSDPIVGSFSNVSEGSVINTSLGRLGVTYRGGDGNDLALHVPTIRTWDGGGTSIAWSQAANWVGDVAPKPGDDLVFPANPVRLESANNFPAGTTFNSITLSGTGYVLLGNLITLIGGVNEIDASGTNTLILPITLHANQTFSSSKPDAGSLSILGTINTNGRLLTIDGASRPTFQNVISGAGGLIIMGTSNTGLVANNTYTGPTIVSSGVLRIDGSQPGSAVFINGGLLIGSGTTGRISQHGGQITPGSSIGPILTAAGVSLVTGTFETSVQGDPSNRVFGKLNVNGSVNLSNTLRVVPNSPLPTGNTFVIINNDGTDPVVGTFAGLSEGSLITSSGIKFKISYIGGDGNDVTLSLVATRTWDGGGTTANWMEAANWVGDVAPVPGDDLVFPAAASQLANLNNFPSDTTFNSITISGAGYELIGSRVCLNSGIVETVVSGPSTVLRFPVKLNANQTFLVSHSVIFNRAIDTNGKILTIDGPGLFTLAPALLSEIPLITGSGGVTRAGSGSTTLNHNNTYTGPTIVTSGSLDIDGSQPSSTVTINGGLLSGGGTTGAITANGGTVHAGSKSGVGSTLNTIGSVSFNSNSTFETEIQGPLNDRKFTQLNVTGAVNLSGALLRLVVPFAPTGITSTIINNDGSDPINGTFTGLPEGSVLTANARQFRISYTGGNGNDVTLTVSGASVQFSASTISAEEGASRVDVTITRTGDTSGASAVGLITNDLAGSQSCSVRNGAASSRCDYEPVFRDLKFAAGETSKTVPVLLIDDSYLEGPETLRVVLSNPTGAVLGVTPLALITISDNDLADGPNPIDSAAFFVRQHYLDFFTREPDPDGLAFWTNQITSCGGDQQCIELRRINVSAAFYLSIEFQQTGYLVERIYKTSYGDAFGSSTLGGPQSISVPIIHLNEFLSDTQQIGSGLVVGAPGWEQVLENNKVAFTNDFVQRNRFASAFPLSMTAAQFVDQLNLNAGNPLSTSERDELVAELIAGTKTRAQALRGVAEDTDLVSAEFNRAFVLMQYFGYLRRNPDDAPDSNHTGYDFWLNKLNQFGGNFIEAEMVKAFIDSIEYRKRFGP